MYALYGFYFLVRHKLLFLRSVSSFLTASTNYVVHLRFFNHCCFPGIDSYLKKLSVVTALVIVPIIFGLIAGLNIKELSVMMFDGIKQVAPTGILLMFAVLYFGTMLDTGLFDPIVERIIRYAKGDPLKVVMGTAILTMMVHLDGDGTATFMIVISAFLPVYRQLKINKLLLPCIVALGVGTHAFGSLVRNIRKGNGDPPHRCCTYFYS